MSRRDPVGCVTFECDPYMHSLPWCRRRDEAQSWMSTLEGFTNIDGHGATGTVEYTHHVPTSDGVNSRDVSPTILRLVNASREMLALLQRLAGKDAVAIAALEQAVAVAASCLEVAIAKATQARSSVPGPSQAPPSPRQQPPHTQRKPEVVPLAKAMGSRAVAFLDGSRPRHAPASIVRRDLLATSAASTPQEERRRADKKGCLAFNITDWNWLAKWTSPTL